MTVLADLGLYDYAVCVMNNVRYYIGKRTNDYQVISYDKLWVCKYFADTNIRIPVGWDDTPGPLSGLNPMYYRVLTGVSDASSDIFTTQPGEVPILYTYGTNLVLDLLSDSTHVIGEGLTPYTARCIYYSKDGVYWDFEYVAADTPSISDYPMYIDNFSSVISNEVLYYVGSFPANTSGLPNDPELECFTVDDIVCRAFKCRGVRQLFLPDNNPVGEWVPRTHPVKFPDGKVFSKITTDASIKDNAIRPVLTVSDNVLSVILPTTTIGSYTTYKSYDGGYTWLGA